ncbi:SET and MYND domain-containing protein 4-like [Sabethes cyaneus]|uniref:SET and MYND domain-containing protein 4-like n=1 Tax=Sabethes cyaneus TaxID=53552 RepID=UPI00237D6C71|nr:SET and MYND domain-containing protein 4-like [Sabethes cyaneus]
MLPSVLPTLTQQKNDLERPLNVYTAQFLLTADIQHDNVIACRDYVLKNGSYINVPELHKSNERAIEVRQKGNELYLARKYQAALEKYNESICWSETGSIHLGIGYANRSAVQFEQENYDIALRDIKLAKLHNYPENLMPKLLRREVDCKDKCRNLNLNNQQFRRIAVKLPAAGIRMEQLPGYGRSMVADRNFSPGDVILEEKPLLSIVNDEAKYWNCDYCSANNWHSLIPCPNCPSVMYCNQECLEKGWRFAHRFECGISTKLHNLSLVAVRLGPRMFFYALTLFEDNAERMMDFCKTNARDGSNPLNFNYASYDPIEELKLFQKMHIPSDKRLSDGTLDTGIFQMLHAAVFFSVYMQHPLVKSIFTTEEKQIFMIHCIQDYQKCINHLIMVPESFINYIYPVASICNHSCDPNTFFIKCSGQLKYIVNRPIAKGEQITISYGPRFRVSSKFDNMKLMEILHLHCICDVCNKHKLKKRLLKEELQPPVPLQHLGTIIGVVENPNCNMAAKLTALTLLMYPYQPVRQNNEMKLGFSTVDDRLISLSLDLPPGTVRIDGLNIAD